MLQRELKSRQNCRSDKKSESQVLAWQVGGVLESKVDYVSHDSALQSLGFGS